MRVNADFSRPVVVTPRDYAWVASPMRGVERVMLDRIGAETGRATSIVRYAPDASFPFHSHPGGEEILVLCGTFSDGERDHPAGCYLRSPPGSCHRPSSRDGTTIFVKLWQMSPQETAPVRIDTNDPRSWQGLSGREVCLLYSDPGETVSLERLRPDAALVPAAVNGAELLVLRGAVVFNGQICTPGSWIRLPAGAQPDLVAGPEGTTVYLKTGHLAGPAQDRRG